MIKGKINLIKEESKGDRVLRGRKSFIIDPKPCDLSMGRLKLK